MDEAKMKKLVVLLTDPMKVYYDKGEIKARYYNPCNYFDEIHMISFCDEDMEEKKIQTVVGNARLKIYSVGKLSTLSLPTLLNRMLYLIKNIGPNVIRAYDPSLRGTLAVYLGKRLNLATVISIHNHFDEQRRFDHRPVLWIRIFLESYVLKNASKVICVSNYVKSYVAKYRTNDITVIYNRVPLEQFYPLEKNNSDFKESHVLLSVGRFEKQKYQECLIRAVKDLDVKLVLIGQGARYGYLKGLCRKLNLEDKVEFVKPVPNSEIHKYYLKSEIFAIATNYEGFCIPVVEAMASGIPIIASDIPAIREILNGNGILVQNSESAFRRAIQQLLKNPEFAIELSRKALGRVKMFDSVLIEEKERDIYENICNQHKILP
ncbi:MAG: glycosyltransferase family 4 protein [Candidatus Omnitrophica bacterium]|nr:glycosyltransferase family 4 protein [Candidatus Omnitrophota bacterium]